MNSDSTQRVCIITGANTGIGKVTAREVARTGARVILACRSEAKTAPVVAEIIEQTGNQDVEFTELDLSRLASVRACAERLLARGLPIHLLINNAGLAGLRGKTSDGFELHFGVNHLGHFLLTLLLMDRIVESAGSAPARIVNVSSRSHYDARALDLARVQERTPSIAGVQEYGVSKLANVLFTRSLVERLAGKNVNVYSLHPGVVGSDIWQRRIPRPIARVMGMFMLTTEDGAKTTLHCALSDDASGETGLYYDKCRAKEPSKLAKDDGVAAELWRRSVEWTGVDWPG